MGQAQAYQCVNLIGTGNEIRSRMQADFAQIFDPAAEHELWTATDDVIGFNLIRTSDGRWFYYRESVVDENNIRSLEVSRKRLVGV